MTGMLASVNSMTEVQLILHTAVDIIDLKNPDQGALGALPNKLVSEIVDKVDHKKPVSATVGDLPMQADIIFNAVSAMLETGVDYIKIGFFPGGDWQDTVSKLTKITQQGHQLIAVLFADAQPDFAIIKALKIAGFSGVMLDTMDKSTGTLSQVISLSKVNDFVLTAKNAQLLCGLAGSLKIDDIPVFLELDADYLGFRGALCEQHNRTAQLDKHAINSILSYFE